MSLLTLMKPLESMPSGEPMAASRFRLSVLPDLLWANTATSPTTVSPVDRATWTSPVCRHDQRQTRSLRGARRRVSNRLYDVNVEGAGPDFEGDPFLSHALEQTSSHAVVHLRQHVGIALDDGRLNIGQGRCVHGQPRGEGNAGRRPDPRCWRIRRLARSPR